MKSICIKTNNSNLLDYLLNELKNTDLKDVCFSLNNFKHYKNVIIHYKGKDLEYFFSEISSILSFLVIDELEENLFKRLITQNYFYFDFNERKKILEICSEIISEDFTDIFDVKFNTLYNNFYDYLSNNKCLVLTGFVNFRLKNYSEMLDEIIDEAVNTFIIEKEYMEFISLLKLYINSQTSSCNCVHLVYTSTDAILLDENKNIITISNDLLNAKYLSDISFSANDFTLNSLLTLLPKKIYVHLINDYIDEFLHTLELAFEDRIVLCNDCTICNMYKSQKKTLIKK